jgi:hypothetical protein
MADDWFQERRADLFQPDYAAGRVIPEDLRTETNKKLAEAFGIPKELLKCKQRYCKDESNKNGWIVVVYRSAYEAERASIALPEQGLNVYYPKTRFRSTRIEKYLQENKGICDTQTGRFAAAFGRYLLVQLPEDQETFATLDIPQNWLEGPFNKNGVVTVLSIAGEYLVTRNEEIVRNRRFHEHRNKVHDPKKLKRFHADEVVRVTDGNLQGWNVRIVDDVPMSYKVASKVGVIVGNSGAIHQVRIAWLEKV